METIIEAGRQRREYSRVEAYLPIEYRVVAQEERDYIRARMSGDKAAVEFRPIADMGGYDPVLEEWLKMLNMKMDKIISLITLQREGYFGLPCRAVNISGGGMSFFLPDAIPLGSIMEIKMVLTTHQPIACAFMGKWSSSNHATTSILWQFVTSIWMIWSAMRSSVLFLNGKEKSSERNGGNAQCLSLSGA